jgi:hypothetical protein
MSLREQVETELRTNILPFWLEHAIDEQYGGFRGQIANDLTLHPFAPKGLILNVRILWTFSKAFSVYGEEVYRQTARRAYDYITQHFWDTEFNGVYWLVDYLARPWVVTHRPAGYFLAPQGEERVGDVSNVVFSNGWVARPDGQVFIYYGSSDTRLHVATSTVNKLLDYVLHTPEDLLRSYACVQQRYALIEKNLKIMGSLQKRSTKKRARR